MLSTERRKRFRWFREFYGLAAPYWASPAKWFGLACVSGAVAAIFGVVWFTLRMNSWYSEFYGNADKMAAGAFFHALFVYVVLTTVWSFVNHGGGYLRSRLTIHWREWMTRRFLALWLKSGRHYLCGLTQQSTDNPDQRIAQDVQLFVSNTIYLTLRTFERLLTLVSFAAVLWSLSGSITIPVGSFRLVVPGYLMWGSVAFALVANGLIYLFRAQARPTGV